MIQTTSEAIDLVDEDYAAVLAGTGCLEKLTHALWANPHKHLLELRGHYFDKLASSFICQRSSQQRLACPWRTMK